MNNRQIVQVSDINNYAILGYAGTNRQVKSRINMFCNWLTSTGQNVYTVNLADYRDHLLARGLSEQTVKAYLSSVRSRYIELSGNRHSLYKALEGHFDRGMSVADKKALVDELAQHMAYSASMQNTRVSVTVIQDEDDGRHLRLTDEEVKELLSQQDLTKLIGLRDHALISLALATGARAGELVALTYDDVFAMYGGEMALRVRKGKGNKQRMIPYGELRYLLDNVKTWLAAAGITSGPVFVKVNKDGQGIGQKHLTTLTVQNILSKYPITRKGIKIAVKPHDLRRTYARKMYESGADIMAIQQNLGHVNPKTTQIYVGVLSAGGRSPKNIYRNENEMARD